MTCCQTDSITLNCEIDLNLLFDTSPERKRFDQRWDEFLESNPYNSKIVAKTGNRLYYLSEQLIPEKRDDRPPLLLVLGNPASQSIANGMFFSFEGNGECISTLTTPAAVIGEDMKNSAELALEHIRHKMGKLDVDLIMEDDGFKPDIGKQKTDKLVKQDDVDFVTGYIWSHVLLASVRSVTKADKFLISANAGPSQIAGKRCDKNFFSTSWQNDQTPMALGEYLNQNGVKSLYVMAPNYAAGKDMARGVESTFKGEIKGKDLTKWPSQLDFSAELAKAKASGAEAIFVFYPGKAGGAFIKQYQQAGLKGELEVLHTTEYIARLLDQGKLKPTRKVDLRVTYHDPCHLKWHQGINDHPRKLLRSMPGVEFVEMEGADACCGLGGAFGISHRDMSLAIQAKKMEFIRDTGAQTVVTACPGCLVQLMDGARRHNMAVDVIHLSQLIVGPEKKGKEKGNEKD